MPIPGLFYRVVQGAAELLFTGLQPGPGLVQMQELKATSLEHLPVRTSAAGQAQLQNACSKSRGLTSETALLYSPGMLSLCRRE